MNHVDLVGRLTKDPELKFLPGSGTATVTFTLAVDRRVPNKNGEREADFIPVVVYGKIAESIANHVTKGQQIGVSGRIQTRSYDAKDGTKRYVTEVVNESITFISNGNSGGKGNLNNQGAQNSQSSRAASSNQDFNANQEFDFSGSIYEDEMTPVDDGDIPF